MLSPRLLPMRHATEHTGPAAACRFPPDERGFLLTEPRIGLGVVERLEQAGVHSLAQLAALGPAVVVRRICEGQGSLAWANRRRALERALLRSRQIGLCPAPALA
ncbi:hypothetical protein [Aquabacterium sp. OR-4]|uniref:hypothetical protein n=1 Tax=Aquabacterium sp. OR-4 TaxID=2978127 RepID=UPI0021B2E8A6|nr:hypothetical protein [Aquabacterium sp. OR-4]MDT7837013.1 hypothetical protein [Aquabacterium sp. OR-4]